MEAQAALFAVKELRKSYLVAKILSCPGKKCSYYVTVTAMRLYFFMRLQLLFPCIIESLTSGTPGRMRNFCIK